MDNSHLGTSGVRVNEHISASLRHVPPPPSEDDIEPLEEDPLAIPASIGQGSFLVSHLGTEERSRMAHNGVSHWHTPVPSLADASLKRPFISSVGTIRSAPPRLQRSSIISNQTRSGPVPSRSVRLLGSALNPSSSVQSPFPQPTATRQQSPFQREAAAGNLRLPVSITAVARSPVSAVELLPVPGTSQREVIPRAQARGPSRANNMTSTYRSLNDSAMSPKEFSPKRRIGIPAPKSRAPSTNARKSSTVVTLPDSSERFRLVIQDTDLARSEFTPVFKLRTTEASPGPSAQRSSGVIYVGYPRQGTSSVVKEQPKALSLEQLSKTHVEVTRGMLRPSATTASSTPHSSAVSFERVASQRAVASADLEHRNLSIAMTSTSIGNDTHHVVVKQEPGLDFLCRRCNGVFGDKIALEDHELCCPELEFEELRNPQDLVPEGSENGMNSSSTRKSELVCGICNRSFSNRTEFEEHSAVHSSVRPYMCAYCGAGFKLSKTLREHKGFCAKRPLQAIGTPGPSLIKKSAAGLKMSRMRHRCLQCPAHFSNPAQLVWHQKAHSRKKELRCLKCEVVFASTNNLSRHMKSGRCNPATSVSSSASVVDSKPELRQTDISTAEYISSFRCKLCGAGFVTEDLLNFHQELHQSVPDHFRPRRVKREHKCDLCGQLCRNVERLRNHKKRCKRQAFMRQAIALNPAVSSVPVPDDSLKLVKPEPAMFVCPLCPKTFTTIQRRQDHYMVHTGERPHQCDGCGRGFTQTSSLRRHQRTSLTCCASSNSGGLPGPPPPLLPMQVGEVGESPFSLSGSSPKKEGSTRASPSLKKGEAWEPSSFSTTEESSKLGPPVKSGPAFRRSKLGTFALRRGLLSKRVAVRCATCHQPFVSRKGLTAHLLRGICSKSRSNVHTFSCNRCKVFLRRSRDLADHRKRVCGKNARRQSNLRLETSEAPSSELSHSLGGSEVPADGEEGRSDVAVPDVVIESVDQVKPFHKCSTCGMKTHRISNLKLHLRKVICSLKRTPQHKIKCLKCGVFFSSSVAFFNHNLKVKCSAKPAGEAVTESAPIPSTTSLNEFEMESQLPPVSAEKKTLCRVCNLTLATLGALKKHTNFRVCSLKRIATHQFPCSKKCGVYFKRRFDQFHHERRAACVPRLLAKVNLPSQIPRDPTPYKCSRCNRGFRAPRLLEIHAMGHTGERPFSCDLCGLAFVLLKQLRGHERNVHKLKPERSITVASEAAVPITPLAAKSKVQKPPMVKEPVKGNRVTGVTKQNSVELLEVGPPGAEVGSEKKENSRLYECGTCHAALSTRDRLSRHIKQGTCSPFPTPRHQHACNGCTTFFKKAALLTMHQRRHQCGPPRPGGLPQEVVSGTATPATVEVGQQPVPTSGDCARKGKRENSDPAELPVAPESKAKLVNQCSTCGKIFINRSCLQKHLYRQVCSMQQSATHPFQCKQCGIYFKLLKSVFLHESSTHSSGKGKSGSRARGTRLKVPKVEFIDEDAPLLPPPDDERNNSATRPDQDRGTDAFLKEANFVAEDFVGVPPIRVFPCPVCELILLSRNTLKKHLRRNVCSHEKDPEHTLQCQNCGLFFISSRAMENHLLTCSWKVRLGATSEYPASDVPQIKLDLDDPKLTQEPRVRLSRFKPRMKNSPPLTIDVFPSINGIYASLASSEMSFVRNIKLEAPGSVATSLDTGTDESIPSDVGLLSRKSKRRRRGDQELFPCSFCRKVFTSRGSLDSHEQVHSGVKPFECSVCGRGFRANYDLRRHKRTARFACVPFLWQEQVAAAEAKTEAPPNDADGEKKGKRRKKRCLFCGKKFPRALLDSHLENKACLRTPVPNFHKPFMCGGCFRSFKYSANLLSHVEKCPVLFGAQTSKVSAHLFPNVLADALHDSVQPL